jgi:hypothetical protein
MEKRTSERVPYSFDTKITAAGKTFDGSIENVSKDGIEYLMTTIIENPKDFIPNEIVEIDFQISSGEMLKLKCQLKWYLEIDPHDKKLLLGMKIMNPDHKYEEFLSNL